MPYQVYLFEYYEPQGSLGRPFYFTNLDEEQLRGRVVDAWDRGLPMTWGGVTADSTKSRIEVFHTEEVAPSDLAGSDLYRFMAEGEDVTNEWITGPAGAHAAAASAARESERESPLRDHRRVMVVHSRNLRARDAMFTFLRALGLSPIEWEQAVAETGVASPHNLDAVRAAMDVGQSVVVLLTAEDRAGLLPELADEDADDVLLRGQPRQNVILEAGLAMGVDRSRVILVELGPIRRASDFDGLNVVRLSDGAPSRNALRG